MQTDIRRHLRVVSRNLHSTVSRTGLRHRDVERRGPVEVVTEHFRRRIDLVRQVNVDAVARVCTQDERLDRNAGLEHSVTVEILGTHEHDSKQRTYVSRARARAWHYPTIKDKLAGGLRLARECFLRSHSGDVVSTFLRSRKARRTGCVRDVIA